MQIAILHIGIIPLGVFSKRYSLSCHIMNRYDPMVIIIATYTHNNPTGLGVYTYELTKELLKKQHDIKLKAYTSSINLKKEFPDTVKTVSQRTSPSFGFQGHVLRILWQQCILPIRMRSQKPSLVFSTVPEGILFPSVKQVITLHDIIPLRFLSTKTNMKYHFKHTLPILIKNSKAIVCVSEFTKREVINYFGIHDKPVFVIYEGYDREKFYQRPFGKIKQKYGIPLDYLLYIGDMKPYKNIEKTLEAFKRLNLKKHVFVIGGRKDARYFPNIKKKIDELALHDRVIMPGYIVEEDLPSLYSEASAYIQPSLYEGFGLPPLEAMACGCPVIVSRAASLPEVCDNAAWYIDPEDVGSIAEGISKVLTDTMLRSSLIQKGLARSKYFSWERSAQEHIKVFKELLRS
jgi:glycosyltransferase involved in cell wall biosynthesis